MNSAIQLHFNLDQNRRVLSDESLEKALEKRKLTYNEAVQLFFDTEAQVELLEKNKQGVLFLSPSKIFILDDRFIILDKSALFQLENNHFFIDRPLDKSQPFLSPELKAIKKLPSRIHRSTLYYSFALMIIKLMDISEDLREIQNTKLYFMLKRCLISDPIKRHFIYI